MTDKQAKKLYFPGWNRAAAVHGWTRKGAVRQAHFGTPHVNPLYQRIWDIALEKSRNRLQVGLLSSLVPAASNPTGEDFRHACHCVALGMDKSSKLLTNAELDRLVALFNLLADPDDLRAVLAWTNPQDEARKRVIWWIRNNCAESYVVAICREKFDTANWQNLPANQLRQLHMTLKNRPAAQERSARHALVAAAENEPF